MIFSYRELEKKFEKPLPGVEAVVSTLTMRAFEVEEVIPQGDDWNLDIKVLPDRAPDAKNPLGMARELAAVLNQSLREEFLALPTDETARVKIVFNAEDIGHLLGVMLGEHEIKECLRRVRVVVESGPEDKLTASIPPERLDINIKEDLADEVARIYGYENLPGKTLAVTNQAVHDADFLLANQVREKMLSEGYTEIYGYTFTDHGDEVVEKPLASDKTYLRTNLKEGMEQAVEFNLEHVLFDKDEVKLFEIGKVFKAGEEELHLAVGHGIKKPKLKIEVVEQPLTALADEVEKLPGNLKPWVKEEVNYHPVSAYPRIIRDIAVWVPEEITIETVSDLIKKEAGELLVEGPSLFDEFKKGERKSLAFRLALQASDQTLSDEVANEVIEKVAQILGKQPNFEVRK